MTFKTVLRTPERRRAFWRDLAIIGGLWSVVWLGVFFGNESGSFEYHLARRLEFHTRDFLGKSPGVHPRLKIYGYDDNAVSEFAAPEINMTDMAKLIETIAAAKPKAIYIDKMFQWVPEGDTGAKLLKETLSRHQLVHAGAVVHKFRIPMRQTMPMEGSAFSLEKMVEHGLEDAAWLPAGSPYVYGPHPSLQGAFEHVGHISYPGRGEYDPLIKTASNTAIRHLTLHAGGTLKLGDHELRLGDETLPLNRRGRAYFNLAPAKTYYAETYSLKTVLNLVRRGRPLTKIEEGDHVLILPLLYTGNFDVRDTPLGRMPGGFLLAANISSILSGEWLTPVGGEWFFVPLASGVAAALGLAFGPLIFWPAWLLLLTVTVGGGLAGFTYGSLVLPWFFPTLAALCSGLTAHARTMSSWALETRRLRTALRGLIPEAKLNQLIEGKGELKLEASEHVVTLMFLDIANFSIIAEQRPPKEIFLTLKEILAQVTRIVHRYGGTVDKTLGDGMLCFFGYSYDGETLENQADRAIECAVEIQRQNVERCIAAAQAGTPILPFRIGINTGSVYIGDLGNGDRIDFTVIGNCVNYAQRLESACDHHSVMLSGTTIDFSSAFNPKMPGFTKRYINIKHHDELIEGIEYDPFHGDPGKREMVLKELRRSLNLERKAQRWPVDDPGKVAVKTEFGHASMVDFSLSGFCVRLDSYLSKGVKFTLTLDGSDGELRRGLASKGIDVIHAEVRWGRSQNDSYIHGIRFLNLSEIQLEHLFNHLREAFSRQSEPRYVDQPVEPAS